MEISGVVTLAAGTGNDNILAGSIFEILPGDGVLQFGLTSDAAVGTPADVLVDVFCGLEVIATSTVPVTRGSMPIFPDDFTLSCPSMAGDRIIVKVRNPSAAARKLFFKVVLDLA